MPIDSQGDFRNPLFARRRRTREQSRGVRRELPNIANYTRKARRTHPHGRKLTWSHRRRETPLASDGSAMLSVTHPPYSARSAAGREQADVTCSARNCNCHIGPNLRHRNPWHGFATRKSALTGPTRSSR